MTFPVVFHEWTWRTSLPLSNNPRQNAGQNDYHDHLAGRPARHTLGRAWVVFQLHREKAVERLTDSVTGGPRSREWVVEVKPRDR